MRLGIALPFQQLDGRPITIAQVTNFARMIEAAGFDGIWLGDAVGRGLPWPDPLIWLSIAAASTEQVELGTAVLQLPLRHPVELAQRVLTIHALTGGRFSLGVGAGSTKKDFDSVGIDFAQRFRIFAESLAIIRGICEGSLSSQASLRAWPQTRGGPSLLIGSWSSESWIRRAAQEYDGWITSGRVGLKSLTEGIKRFRDAGGKRAIAASIDTDLSAPSAKLAGDEPFHLRCAPDAAAERLALLAELGYDDVLLHEPRHPHRDLTWDDFVSVRALLTKESALRGPVNSVQ
jgi:alkanesulfonate monooxygenase SsuD/methylene tetrahydromethanopterin reductase-like flavin-dependent oxidoreductase (luciferase family)